MSAAFVLVAFPFGFSETGALFWGVFQFFAACSAVGHGFTVWRLVLLDCTQVFTDKLTKLIIAVPTTVSIDGAGYAQLFFEHVFRHHGLPKVIVSDRDPRFTGQFWKTLFALTGTCLNMSTSNYPQTDGQTERVNRVMEEMLRAYVAPHQDEWDEHLVAVEFAYNSSVHASTGETPFFLNYGQHPVTPLAQVSTIPHSTIPANEISSSA